MPNPHDKENLHKCTIEGGEDYYSEYCPIIICELVGSIIIWNGYLRVQLSKRQDVCKIRHEISVNHLYDKGLVHSIHCPDGKYV